MVQKETRVASKNNARFIHCISKINDVQIDNAEDLDVLMPMYNFLKYKKKKKKLVICGIVTEMNQVTLFLLILNLLNTRRVLQETSMMVMMMQTKLVKIKMELLYH